MLVLSRKAGERIWIGDDISVTVVRITGGGVRIGIEAPHEMPVVREELKEKMERAEVDEFKNGPSTLKFPSSNSKAANE
ncbi:carbon storage regulator CsrA [bacterium]|nr:carbon storage regulator CsrA [bacterium]